MTTTAGAAPKIDRASHRVFLPRVWLLSSVADQALLLGGVLVSFALFGAWQVGWLDPGQLVLLWVFVFHGPHFWATVSRTYLDRDEWRQRRRLLIGSVGWFLVGPAMVGAALLLDLPQLSKLFFFSAAIWAYHHVVKQHFGFMALYRARAGEFDRRELMLHKRYVVASLWLPAIITLSGSPNWLAAIPFVPAISPANAATFLEVHSTIAGLGSVLFWGLQAAFALHLLDRLRRGQRINLQETAVAACAIALHWVVVRAVLARPEAFYAFVPLVTIYHNIQYHALVWHFNRRRYGAEGARERHGFAWHANRSLLTYFGLGVAYTLLTIGVDFYGLAALDPQRFAFAPVFAGAVWGWSFMHYWLDSKIWHVRHDVELQRVLGFGSAALQSAESAPPLSAR